MNKLITLLKNIKYLMNNRLNESQKIIVCDVLERFDSYYKYEILDDLDYINNMPMLSVYDYNATIDLLLESPKSFCRFGDGEINLIEGNDIPFQEYNEDLGKRLKSILSTKNDSLYVGINYNYFHNTRRMNDYNRKFYLYDVKEYRERLVKYCNPDTKYIAAGFNQLYMVMDEFNFESYYEKVRDLFLNKELILFCGEGILDNLKYNVFDRCSSIKTIQYPSKNAYSSYDDIFKCAQSFSKDKVMCFILGPTSKVLVNDLNNLGYMAWDIGHLAKDYDAYMKKRTRSATEIANFFMPD